MSCTKIVNHFFCKLHRSDLHNISKLTDYFNIDAHSTAADSDGYQVSRVTDAEVELFSNIPMASEIEPRFSIIVADKDYILSRTIKVSAQ
ncbi:hypothetical protein JI59_01040 [Novosphingobium pentaromativorans US6-1]|nr:hypothetical protein JI59_01040 [Novosphingobium pentaromativorans US6-1]